MVQSWNTTTTEHATGEETSKANEILQVCNSANYTKTEKLEIIEDLFTISEKVPNCQENYDAIVIYAKEDELFANHLIQRLTPRLKLFVPNHSELENVQEVVDIINGQRVKKIIAVLSTSFFNDTGRNKFYTELAIHHSLKFNDFILLPVIYENKPIDNMNISFQYLTKLKYDPKKTYANFWKNIMKSFGIFDLTEDEMKMDFHGIEEEPSIKIANNCEYEKSPNLWYKKFKNLKITLRFTKTTNSSSS